MQFQIEFSKESQREFEKLKVFKRREVFDAVQLQLRNQPDVGSRNRKCLGDQVTADFEYVPPLWELRIGDTRVFYEVDRTISTVFILAVRQKPTTKTTSQVLNEKDDG